MKKRKARAKKPAKKPEASGDLNAMQEKFCSEYALGISGKGITGKEAATRAGYSEKTAEQQASRLLRNVKVLARVQELQAEQRARLAITADDVVIRIARILRLEEVEKQVAYEEHKKRYTDKDGHRVTEESRVPVLIDVPPQLRDALKAGELIGKHLGMYKDDKTIKIALPVVITGADQLED